MNITVVIPSYKTTNHIESVINKIGSEVSTIIVVDDACPEASGDYVIKNCNDPRVIVLKHSQNQGVGGAMITGYKAALALKSDIIVKLDGDGQMNPVYIPAFIAPIIKHKADYTKGNRFYYRSYLTKMPFIRIFGNLILSFLVKVVTGYWDIMDPTNGYTAIHGKVLQQINLDRIETGYFFENDILHNLSLQRAVVLDIPMRSSYGSEVSAMNIKRIIFAFPPKFIKKFFKRLGYQYFIRDFNLASLELLFSIVFIVFGTWFGLKEWHTSTLLGVPATAGKVMIATLPLLTGIQLLLSFINFDVFITPKIVLYDRIPNERADEVIKF